jgi:hypothetical protein
MPLAIGQGKRHASHAPGDDGMNFSRGVVPWRVPGLVTERPGILPKSGTSGSRRMGAIQTAWHPDATPKRFFPYTL